ncbi:hypothetical protein F4677DRAFT_33026 [Hypoxylon crocopeplum]|nr:hypothetical protein F4677DRAFT_33026 [Hypoxylon crocopeplum]
MNPNVPNNLTPDDLEELQGAELADQISTHFTSNPRLQYAGVAGLGTHGGALLFREWAEGYNSSRRIIVKYSLDEESDEHLRNESKCLEYLRGAEHIAQLISLPETELNVSGTGKRPTIALEFMHHGDGVRFRMKMDELDYEVAPSRLLWRMFLCLVRQMVAMAYPPRGGPNAPVSREEIRISETRFGLSQNSPHLGNVVFGDLSDDIEHKLTPILKLIDFGRGEIDEDTGFTQFKNVFGAGAIMVHLALPTTSARVLNTHYDDNIVNRYWMLSGQMVETKTHEALLSKWNIDVELRDLIALCQSPADIPTLPYLLARCEEGVKKTLEDFDSDDFSPTERQRETDDWMEAFIKYAFLDADIQDTPHDLTRPTINTQVGTTLVGLLDSQYSDWIQIPPRQSKYEHNPTLWGGFNEAINRMRNTSMDDID